MVSSHSFQKNKVKSVVRNVENVVEGSKKARACRSKKSREERHKKWREDNKQFARQNGKAHAATALNFPWLRVHCQIKMCIGADEVMMECFMGHPM